MNSSVMDSSIVVAVRVRPFSEREIERNAERIVDMPDVNTTLIRNPRIPSEEPKRFTCDYSLWSHDGYSIQVNGYLQATTGSRFVDQRGLFELLGREILANTWKGYNCSLFAYGQTGAGKSFSIVGFNGNRGIVPLICEELFREIEMNSALKTEVNYHVSISMLEIYCEKVRDLLNVPKSGNAPGLRVREHPKMGFFVEGLSVHPVTSYCEIERRISEGTKQRTIRATNLNVTSSRAHTIVKLHFTQSSNSNHTTSSGTALTKSSEINLVDLAGSERHKSAGPDGERLKEGIVINKSLSTLGRVIKALYEKSTKAANTIQVPYRDSVLTSLLKNALGGNSRTIMLAAISPADTNYDETFADRCKSIKTRAVVNESVMKRLILELKDENTRLMEMIKRDGIGESVASKEEVEALKRQLSENERQMVELERSWQHRMHHERAPVNLNAKKRREVPHLWNINEDPALTNVLVHFLEIGENLVGSGADGKQPHVLLRGFSILPEHAMICNERNKKITIRPLAGANIRLNGKLILSGETTLRQNDRLHFGGNHLYVYVNPLRDGVLPPDKISYDMAQGEIARNSAAGNMRFHALLVDAGDNSRVSPADLALEGELIAIMPHIHRANSMAEEMKKAVSFELMLIPPELASSSHSGDVTQVGVKVHNRADDTVFVWDVEKFMARYNGMQELYENYVERDGSDEGDDVLSLERDPFYEPADAAIEIGSTRLYLKSLSLLMELNEDKLPIVDIHGAESGTLSVALIPCSAAGVEILGECVESPEQLVGRNISFKVKILSARGLPRRIDLSYCKYSFFDRPEVTTDKAAGTSPAYAHEELYIFRPVTMRASGLGMLVDYLKRCAVDIVVCGTQRTKDYSPHSSLDSSRSKGSRRREGASKNE